MQNSKMCFLYAYEGAKNNFIGCFDDGTESCSDALTLCTGREYTDYILCANDDRQ